MERPPSIEDRVARSDVAVIVNLESEKVDEFAQELQGILHTLGGRVVHIRATPNGRGARPR